MAKVYGNLKKSGRVGASVFAIRAGEVIERAWNPVVLNPNTQAQVEQRAKFKLMSQLSAVFAPFIAIPKEGSKSSRNLFVEKNSKLAGYADGKATMEMQNIELTSSVVALPVVTATRGETNVEVALGVTSQTELSRVVYVAMVRQDDGALRLLGTTVVSEPGLNNAFAGVLPKSFDEVFVYAYGMRDNTERARVIYGDLTVVSAEQIAQIIATRQLTTSDITLTETRSAYIGIE